MLFKALLIYQYFDFTIYFLLNKSSNKLDFRFKMCHYIKNIKII